MGANICNIKFGMFLVIVFIVGLNMDDLYCGMANRPSSIVDLSIFQTGSRFRRILRVKAWFIAKA